MRRGVHAADFRVTSVPRTGSVAATICRRVRLASNSTRAWASLASKATASPAPAEATDLMSGVSPRVQRSSPDATRSRSTGDAGAAASNSAARAWPRYGTGTTLSATLPPRATVPGLCHHLPRRPPEVVGRRIRFLAATSMLEECRTSRTLRPTCRRDERRAFAPSCTITSELLRDTSMHPSLALDPGQIRAGL